MRSRVRRAELDELAAKVGMEIQKDCSGFRVVKGSRYAFPDGGTCPTATARECYIFLRGVLEGKKL